MFIIILEVLTDQTETKVIKLKGYLNFIKNQQPFRFSEIRATDHQSVKKLNQTLLQLEKTNLIKYISRISGHQI